MPTFAVVLLILVGILAPAQAQELHFWAEELKPVFGVLQDAHLSGSIGLSGRCDPAHLPGFPQFRSAGVTASSPLAALREIAASDPGMRVKQEADGTIRMTERGVPSDILNVRINHIVFENYAHHDIHSANFAVRVILSAPEVRSFMAAHDIAAPQIDGPGGVPGNAGDQWPPESPHISGSLDNVTVLEALDRVLAAFPGEVFVYWNCPETHNKSEQVPTKTSNKQQDWPSPSPDCSPSGAGDTTSSAVVPAGLPNPFCMPHSLLSGLPRLFPAPEEPTHQRRIFLFFFAMKKGFGGKMLVVNG